MSEGVQGRWTIWLEYGETPEIRGPETGNVGVPVVPCDEAAVERAARALCEADGAEWDACQVKQTHIGDARAALRAAGAVE